MQSLESDIYVPMWWVDLSFNSRVILDSFLFPNCKLQNHPKNLWLNCHLIWHSTYYSYQRLFSIWIQKCSVSKQEKTKDCSWVSWVIKGWWHRFGSVVYCRLFQELRRPRRWWKCKQTAENDTYYRFPWHHPLITQLSLYVIRKFVDS